MVHLRDITDKRILDYIIQQSIKNREAEKEMLRHIDDPNVWLWRALEWRSFEFDLPFELDWPWERPPEPKVVEPLTDEPIVFRHKPITIGRNEWRKVLSGSRSGINWTYKFTIENAPFYLRPRYSGNVLFKHVYQSWAFEWSRLAEQGIVGFDGHIDLAYIERLTSVPVTQRINVSLRQPTGQWVEMWMGAEDIVLKRMKSPPQFQFEVHLTPVRRYGNKKKWGYGKGMAAAATDSVLVVGEDRIDVEKKYLSEHSPFFERLFNGDFLERTAAEIPIHEINYKDLKGLLKSIRPDAMSRLPKNNVQRLLELSDRFLMPVVTENIEEHLLLGSSIPFCRLLLLADRFGMKKLLEQCFLKVRYLSDISDIMDSDMFDEYSDATHARLHFMSLSMVI